MFPAPRSLSVTAMSSGSSPGTKVAAGDPQELPADAHPPSEEVKAWREHLKPFWKVNGGKPPHTGCVPWVQKVPRGLQLARCPHNGSPQPQNQQEPGTQWVLACQDTDLSGVTVGRETQEQHWLCAKSALGISPGWKPAPRSCPLATAGSCLSPWQRGVDAPG